jgi:hypothetical protein
MQRGQLPWKWFRFPFVKPEQPVLREVSFGQSLPQHIWFVVSCPFGNCIIFNPVHFKERDV